MMRMHSSQVLESNRPSFFRSPVVGQLIVNSLLTISLAEPDDMGTYSCTVRNSSLKFHVHSFSAGEHALVPKGVTLPLDL